MSFDVAFNLNATRLFKSTLFVCALSSLAFSENPIVNYHYLADPTSVVVGDSIYYIIVDTDDENIASYNIKAYYLLSSKDMKNWSDHGEIFRVPRDVSWANGAWAPAAVWNNEKMFIYFPNGASGIGVVSSSNPAGPYIDPIGGPLINPSKGHCDGIAWCFDPGVFVDDDGQGYLIWGGGNNTARPYGDNFSMVKLNADMISWSGSILRMSGMNESFEAPYITKRNNLYYLSYNAQGQTIDYATSNSPTGPWQYRGEVLANPNINGQNINAYNNNHHGFAEFKGKWYAAYHDRRVAIANNHPEPAFHRSVSVDLLEYNSDGTFKPLKFTNSGPTQIQNFNPYDSIIGTTMSLANNIRSITQKQVTTAATSLLIPMPSLNGGSWTRLSNVDFKNGATQFIVNAASLNAQNEIEIRQGSADGDLAGKCALSNTGSLTQFQNTTCEVINLTGVIPSLYLKYTGPDSTASIKWWRFDSTPLVEQGPYDPENIITLPGKLEAENFDVGGAGKAYFDQDYGNNGEVYRSESVDIGTDSAGSYALAWTQVGEWIEYTVNIENSGLYNFEARVSSGADGGAFSLWLDDQAISQNIEVPNTTSWGSYQIIEGSIDSVTAGPHILKIQIEGSYFNLDFINFSFQDDITPNTPIQLKTNNRSKYIVYNSLGYKLGVIEHINPNDLNREIAKRFSNSGVYLVQSLTGNIPTQVQKIFITKTTKGISK